MRICFFIWLKCHLKKYLRTYCYGSSSLKNGVQSKYKKKNERKKRPYRKICKVHFLNQSQIKPAPEQLP